MAVVITIPERSYTPRAISANPVIPDGTKSVRLTLTRVAWPVGAVGSIAVTMPNGDAGPQCTFGGGTAIAKDGSTSLVSGLTMGNGDGSNLPSGTYGVEVVVLQTVTTAILIERF